MSNQWSSYGEWMLSAPRQTDKSVVYVDPEVFDRYFGNHRREFNPCVFGDPPVLFPRIRVYPSLVIDIQRKFMIPVVDELRQLSRDRDAIMKSFHKKDPPDPIEELDRKLREGPKIEQRTRSFIELFGCENPYPDWPLLTVVRGRKPIMSPAIPSLDPPYSPFQMEFRGTWVPPEPEEGQMQ